MRRRSNDRGRERPGSGARAFIPAALVALSCSAPGAAQVRPASLTDSTYGGRLFVPPGIRVTEYARVPRPRFMALGPDGEVYVSQPGEGQVTRLDDRDGDGVAESQRVAASGLDRPHGLAFSGGWLHVAGTGAVVRLRLDSSGVASGAPEVIARYSGGGGHWTRTVIFGADSAMYVSIGSSCNVCVEEAPDRAAVMRYGPGGGPGRVFASGLRNAVGMAVHPGTGDIWVTQNERDNLRPEHEDLPPEEVNILADGGHYGWPWCYGNRIPTPDAAVHDPSRCPATIPPALELPAHSAPLGIAFLQAATRLPEELRGDALVAYHGSWNRRSPTGAKVVRVRVRDGRPVAVEDFVYGWQGDDGRRWGRPVDVLVARDGAVLVSDDQAGVIYRVSR